MSGELLATEIIIVFFTTIAYGITKERLILKIDGIITLCFTLIDFILLQTDLKELLI